LRKDKPYQLEDRVEQCFHEKSQSVLCRLDRLFDQTISALRFKIGAKEIAIEPTLNLLAGSRRRERKAAAQALAKTFKANERILCIGHQHARQGQEISDRWRGFCRRR